MPKENLVIYLYVPWKIGINLTQGRDHQKYLKGKSEDIEEKDIKNRVNSENLYLKLANSNKHWKIVNCVDDGKMLPIETIHKKILSILKSRKYLS